MRGSFTSFAIIIVQSDTGKDGLGTGQQRSCNETGAMGAGVEVWRYWALVGGFGLAAEPCPTMLGTAPKLTPSTEPTLPVQSGVP